mmetsp:Transcript_6959/g.10275  ORF Transcript_6959/g.10275 Transcript_6959/m.10275 type:complete len:84 (+) Transcript_6959:134-385(+)
MRLDADENPDPMQRSADESMSGTQQLPTSKLFKTSNITGSVASQTKTQSQIQGGEEKKNYEKSIKSACRQLHQNYKEQFIFTQ